MAARSRDGRTAWTVALGVALVTLAAVLTALPTAGPAAARVAHPLLHVRGFADPSVVRYAGGYVAVATGIRAPRAVSTSPTGPWRMRRNALVRLPRWARTNGVWASDMVKVRHRWLLYFSAPVRGLGPGGRCIGVAASRQALGAFHSVGPRPLICPRGAWAPRAFDRVRGHRRHLPRTGVIDPSSFRGRHGRPYLLYKTQGFPSSIRIVKLSRKGTRVAHRAHSRQLVRLKGTVENPVLVRRGHHYVLFTSERYYGTCAYRTTWRRAGSLHGLAHARHHTLLKRGRLGVCGPGGADIVVRPHGRSLVFFHGWTCGRGRHACPRHFHLDRGPHRRARRALYAARLHWTHRGPRVRGLLRPH